MRESKSSQEIAEHDRPAPENQELPGVPTLSMRPALQVLQDEHQKWTAYRAKCAAEGDEEGIHFASQVEAICAALENLVNEKAELTFRQVDMVEQMIHRIASESNNGIMDHGGAGLLSLSLATYINSCNS